MNKNELIANIAEKAGMTKINATKALEATISSIQEGVKESGKVTIVGFGTLKSKDVPASKIKTPAGKMVDLPAHKRISFSVGSTFKDFVNNK